MSDKSTAVKPMVEGGTPSMLRRSRRLSSATSSESVVNGRASPEVSTPKSVSKRRSSATESVENIPVRRSSRLSNKVTLPETNKASKIIKRRSSANEVQTPKRRGTKSTDKVIEEEERFSRRCVSESPTGKGRLDSADDDSASEGLSKRSARRNLTETPSFGKQSRTQKPIIKLTSVDEDPSELVDTNPVVESSENTTTDSGSQQPPNTSEDGTESSQPKECIGKDADTTVEIVPFKKRPVPDTKATDIVENEEHTEDKIHVESNENKPSRESIEIHSSATNKDKESESQNLEVSTADNVIDLVYEEDKLINLVDEEDKLQSSGKQDEQKIVESSEIEEESNVSERNIDKPQSTEKKDEQEIVVRSEKEESNMIQSNILKDTSHLPSNNISLSTFDDTSTQDLVIQPGDPPDSKGKQHEIVSSSKGKQHEIVSSTIDKEINTNEEDTNLCTNSRKTEDCAKKDIPKENIRDEKVEKNQLSEEISSSHKIIAEHGVLADVRKNDVVDRHENLEISDTDIGSEENNTPSIDHREDANENNSNISVNDVNLSASCEKYPYDFDKSVDDSMSSDEFSLQIVEEKVTEQNDSLEGPRSNKASENAASNLYSKEIGDSNPTFVCNQKEITEKVTFLKMNDEEITSNTRENVDDAKEISSNAKNEISSDAKNEISSDVKNEIPSHTEVTSSDARKEISSDAENEISSDAKKEISSDVQNEISSNAKNEISSVAKNEFSSDAKNEIPSHTEVTSSDSSDAENEISSDTKKEISSDVQNEISSNAKNEISSVAKNEIPSHTEVTSSDAKKEISSDTKKEISSDVQNEISSNVKNEISNVAKNEISNDAKNEISSHTEVTSSDAEKEISSDAEKEISSDAEKEISSDAEKEIHSDTEEVISKDVEEDISGDFIEEISSEVEEVISGNSKEGIPNHAEEENSSNASEEKNSAVCISNLGSESVADPSKMSIENESCDDNSLFKNSSPKIITRSVKSSNGSLEKSGPVNTSTSDNERHNENESVVSEHLTDSEMSIEGCNDVRNDLQNSTSENESRNENESAVSEYSNVSEKTVEGCSDIQNDSQNSCTNELCKTDGEINLSEGNVPKAFVGCSDSSLIHGNPEEERSEEHCEGNPPVNRGSLFERNPANDSQVSGGLDNQVMDESSGDDQQLSESIQKDFDTCVIKTRNRRTFYDSLLKEEAILDDLNSSDGKSPNITKENVVDFNELEASYDNQKNKRVQLEHGSTDKSEACESEAYISEESNCKEQNCSKELIEDEVEKDNDTQISDDDDAYQFKRVQSSKYNEEISTSTSECTGKDTLIAENISFSQSEVKVVGDEKSNKDSHLDIDEIVRSECYEINKATNSRNSEQKNSSSKKRKFEKALVEHAEEQSSSGNNQKSKESSVISHEENSPGNNMHDKNGSPKCAGKKKRHKRSLGTSENQIEHNINEHSKHKKSINGSCGNEFSPEMYNGSSTPKCTDKKQKSRGSTSATENCLSDETNDLKKVSKHEKLMSNSKENKSYHTSPNNDGKENISPKKSKTEKMKSEIILSDNECSSNSQAGDKNGSSKHTEKKKKHKKSVETLEKQVPKENPVNIKLVGDAKLKFRQLIDEFMKEEYLTTALSRTKSNSEGSNTEDSSVERPSQAMEEEEDTSSEDAESFLDREAMEGEEDTPSEGSNDIPITGEDVGYSSSDIGEDESYENDSFVDDEEYELLSGSDYNTSGDEAPESTPPSEKNKWSRIITIDDSSEEEDNGENSDKKNESPQDSHIRQKLSSQDSSDCQNNTPVEMDIISVDSVSPNKSSCASPSVIIQENISVEDITDPVLKERINEVVEMFCNKNLSNKNLSKGDLTLGFSLGYSPKAAESTPKQANETHVLLANVPSTSTEKRRQKTLTDETTPSTSKNETSSFNNLSTGIASLDPNSVLLKKPKKAKISRKEQPQKTPTKKNTDSCKNESSDFNDLSTVAPSDSNPVLPKKSKKKKTVTAKQPQKTFGDKNIPSSSKNESSEFKDFSAGIASSGSNSVLPKKRKKRRKKNRTKKFENEIKVTEDGSSNDYRKQKSEYISESSSQKTHTIKAEKHVEKTNNRGRKPMPDVGDKKMNIGGIVDVHDDQFNRDNKLKRKAPVETSQTPKKEKAKIGRIVNVNLDKKLNKEKKFGHEPSAETLHLPEKTKIGGIVKVNVCKREKKVKHEPPVEALHLQEKLKIGGIVTVNVSKKEKKFKHEPPAEALHLQEETKIGGIVKVNVDKKPKKEKKFRHEPPVETLPLSQKRKLKEYETLPAKTKTESTDHSRNVDKTEAEQILLKHPESKRRKKSRNETYSRIADNNEIEPEASNHPESKRHHKNNPKEISKQVTERKVLLDMLFPATSELDTGSKKRLEGKRKLAAQIQGQSDSPKMKKRKISTLLGSTCDTWNVDSTVIKPSLSSNKVSLSQEMFHPKDIHNRMLFDSKRVKRMKRKFMLE